MGVVKAEPESKYRSEGGHYIRHPLQHANENEVWPQSRIVAHEESRQRAQQLKLETRDEDACAGGSQTAGETFWVETM